MDEHLHEAVALAEAMKRLLKNDDFQKVFEKAYVEDWAITQAQNIAIYNAESRGQITEQMVARSIFSIFCSDIIAEGNVAKEELADILEQERAEV